MPYRVVQLFGGRRDEWTLIGEYDAFPNDGGGGKQIEEGPVAEDRNKTVS
jgi:hypothetical protein